MRQSWLAPLILNFCKAVLTGCLVVLVACYGMKISITATYSDWGLGIARRFCVHMCTTTVVTSIDNELQY